MFQLNFHTGKPQSRMERIHILTHHMDMCIPVHWLFIRLFIQRTKYDNLASLARKENLQYVSHLNYILLQNEKKTINETMDWVMSL